MVGRDTFGDHGARSLLDGPNEGTDRAVYSMTDGLGKEQVGEIPLGRREFLDRLEVAAYRGEFKAIAGPSRSVRLFGVSGQGPLGVPPSAPHGAEADAVGQLSLDALDLAAARIASQPYHGSVKQRLAGWGY